MNSVDHIVLEWVDRLLIRLGCPHEMANPLDRILLLVLIILVALLVDYTIRNILLRLIRKIVVKTKALWDDILFDTHVLRRLCNIITPVLIYILLPIAFPAGEEQAIGLQRLLSKGVEIWMIINILRFVNALLKALYELADHRQEWQGRPIKGLMQTGQVIAVAIAVILIVSILINRSPAILLTGLGASAAVMMLIFKDSILGLVAGVQLSANNMLKVGDWISMPKHGIDGEVEEVALTIVKVRQWDKTLAMLPPYLLISESFSNWAGMREAGGRRIKRSLNFDMASIRFLGEKELSELQADEQLKGRISRIKGESDEGEELTNLDLYMRYMNLYLREHPRVHDDMTLLVRQLQPTQWGLPVEFYCFSKNTNWAPYENLQSEIISYATALAQRFGLRVFQYPLSQDLMHQ
uniref:mechanosensitive ion channel family protein n=1 Tax=Alistipes sp. TaxID=1872444 RepID=UPI004056782B